MLNLRGITLGSLLALSFMMITVEAQASQNDAQVMEELAKFTDESEKMRENFIVKMKEDHLKFINDMYDMRLAHAKEMSLLWKQLKPNNKEANEGIRDQIHEKRKAFKKAEEKFKDEFHDNILKKKNKEFRQTMKKREKELKEKYKD